VNCDPGGAGVLRPAARARTDQFSVYVGRAQPKRVLGAVRVFPPLPPKKCVQGGLGFSFRGQCENRLFVFRFKNLFFVFFSG
jgi:hypothetical protein